MGDHYLPRHLLNGFAKPATQSRRSAAIFRYEVPSAGAGKNLTVATVANETGMYGDMEPVLQSEIEQPTNPVIERLRRQVGPVPTADYSVLARYVLTAIRRVPDGRARSAASLPGVAASLRQSYAEQLDQLRQFPDRVEEAKEIEKKLDAAFKKILAEPFQWLWTKTLLPENFERTIRALSAMTWFVHAAPAGKQFLIGDVPVILDRSVGLKEKEAMWLMPISSDRLLSVSYQRAAALRSTLPAPTVRSFNANTIVQASRFIFARDAEAWITRAIQEETQRRNAADPARKAEGL
ncbi:DUF4238 domain-containing protein [Variovorax ginsengisoli]|uniref:DUF4238 domain-containing protein n=1 Tax=Variovorax ginsengisoli TaxID=363844 RepID=A0ABT9SFD8_9BURK|nr:DUF4238 domain-containing protein [Variovorax ginsengisoli]MDP9902945.1 hypothetical protein [Variovorax ginsengisoli]